jgi:putative transposase
VAFWQQVIGAAPDYERQLDYLHDNPVKPGQVDRVTDWPYSSFQHQVGRGIYPLKWAVDDKIRTF